MRNKEGVEIAGSMGKRDKFIKMRTAFEKKVHNILSLNSVVTTDKADNFNDDNKPAAYTGSSKDIMATLKRLLT